MGTAGTKSRLYARGVILPLVAIVALAAALMPQTGGAQSGTDCDALDWRSPRDAKSNNSAKPELIRASLGSLASPVARIAFDPQGAGRLAVGDQGGQLAAWDAARSVELWKLKLDAATANVDAVAFSADGRFVAAGTSGGVVRIVDAQTGKVTASMEVPDPKATNPNGGLVHPRNAEAQHFVAVAFTPDSRTLVASTMFGHLLFWSAESGKLLGAVPTGAGAMQFTFSRFEEVIAANTGIDLIYYDLRSQSVIRRITKPESSMISTFATTPDLRFCAVATAGEIQLLDMATGKIIRHWFTDTYIQKVAFSEDASRIVVFGRDLKQKSWLSGRATVSQWDVAADSLVYTAEIPGWMEESYSYNFNPPVDFDPNLSFMASGEGKGNTVKVWRLP